MEKLTLEQLAPYLPYELKMKSKDNTIYLLSTNNSMGGKLEKRDIYSSLQSEYKPILHPLSDMKRELLNEFLMEFFNGEYWINEEYSEIQFMYDLNNGIIKISIYTAFAIREWYLKKHIDILGLIDKGLAIDINTIINPFNHKL